jgi:hypothetical protein
MENPGPAALNHRSKQYAYGKIITRDSLMEHGKDLSKYFLRFLEHFPNGRGKEVYTDWSDCIVEMSLPNGSPGSPLELDIYGKTEKVRNIMKGLIKEKAVFFTTKSNFSEFRSGEEISSKELMDQTYTGTTEGSKWHDGIIRDLIEERYVDPQRSRRFSPSFSSR